MLAQAVAVFQQDQVFLLHRLRGNGVQPRQRVVGGRRRQQFVVRHMRPLQACHVIGQRHQSRVQAPGLQLADQPMGQVLAQKQPQAGETLAQHR